MYNNFFYNENIILFYYLDSEIVSYFFIINENIILSFLYI